eukprot:10381290-Ditylum_brightwellii.AAC.1
MKTVGMVLQGNCNAGVSISKEKGAYGLWSFWLNKKGIARVHYQLQHQKELGSYNALRQVSFVQIGHWVMRGNAVPEYL